MTIEEFKDNTTKRFCYFLENMETDEVIMRLLEKCVLQKYQIEEISAKPLQRDKNSLLLDMLSKRPTEEIPKIIKCFKKSNQEHIAEAMLGIQPEELSGDEDSTLDTEVQSSHGHRSGVTEEKFPSKDMLMTKITCQRFRDNIRNNINFLVGNVQPDDILTQLLRSKVLTWYQLQQIDAEPIQYHKVYRLLEKLMRRPKKDIPKIFRCFYETNQQHIAGVLLGTQTPRPEEQYSVLTKGLEIMQSNHRDITRMIKEHSLPQLDATVSLQITALEPRYNNQRWCGSRWNILSARALWTDLSLGKVWTCPALLIAQSAKLEATDGYIYHALFLLVLLCTYVHTSDAETIKLVIGRNLIVSSSDSSAAPLAILKR